MRSNFALLCGTALAALATAAFSPGLALAADDGVSSASSGPSTLAEVVVTARRANESLQKVPVAVTVIGDSALIKRLQPAKYADEKFGVPTITDILKELEKPGRDPRPPPVRREDGG